MKFSYLCTVNRKKDADASGEGEFTIRPARIYALPSVQKRTTEGRRKGKKIPIEKGKKNLQANV